jgi:hypothetical protein
MGGADSAAAAVDERSLFSLDEEVTRNNVVYAVVLCLLHVGGKCLF